MALSAQPQQTHAPEIQSPMQGIADWFEVYYTPEAPANIVVAPKLGALEQMYAYF
jgi:hypothetical protein